MMNPSEELSLENAVVMRHSFIGWLNVSFRCERKHSTLNGVISKMIHNSELSDIFFGTSLVMAVCIAWCLSSIIFFCGS
jgi:hypothetical protein